MVKYFSFSVFIQNISIYQFYLPIIKNVNDTPTYAVITKIHTSLLKGDKNEKKPGGSLCGFLYKIAIPAKQKRWNNSSKKRKVGK